MHKKIQKIFWIFILDICGKDIRKKMYLTLSGCFLTRTVWTTYICDSSRDRQVRRARIRPRIFRCCIETFH